MEPPIWLLSHPPQHFKALSMAPFPGYPIYILPTVKEEQGLEPLRGRAIRWARATVIEEQS